MDKILDRDAVVRATPVAEGVRFECGTATACALRNRDRYVTVRVYHRDLVTEAADIRDRFQNGN